MNIYEIAQFFETNIENTFHTEDITELLIDSRQLIFPRNTLFFALKTGKNDGHSFISQLIEKGVTFFIVNQNYEFLESKELLFIKVSNTLEALQKLAAQKRSLYSYPVLSITGSNAKTIVKEWISQLLTPDYSWVKSPKSYNSQIGVPLSVWQMNEKHNFGIFEAGISMPNEMQNLQKIINPDYGIFTNIGTSHDEFFDSKTQKINEKLLLFINCKLIFYCKDQLELSLEIEKFVKKNNIKTYTWSFEDANSDIYFSKKEISSKGLKLQYKTKNGFAAECYFPLLDSASLENICHCITIAQYFKVSSESIEQKVKSIKNISMRLSLKEAINGSYLIDDSYNNDLAGLKVALNFLSRQSLSLPKVVILSDILETSLEQENISAEVLKLCKENNITQIISVGEQKIKIKFSNEETLHFSDTETLLLSNCLTKLHSKLILVKGARNFGFERIVSALEKKSHGTVAEINLEALIHNFNFFRNQLPRNVKTMAMVKSLSYGTGTYEIAGALEYYGVDYLCVAYPDEGINLRNEGIQKPIMVFNAEGESVEKLNKYKLEPTVFSQKSLNSILESANNSNSKVNIHIEIDTGMHRLGFLEEDLYSTIPIFEKEKNVIVKSIFSHFAASEDDQMDDFTQNQINALLRIANKLENVLGYEIMKHIANSSGISRHNQSHLDMVRLGIGLYGISPEKEVHSKLKPIITLSTRIAQIKIINENEGVGYNLSQKTKNKTKLGIVEIGYGDGLSRFLGNGNGRFWVGNQIVPTVGKICMDMCMIDLTETDAQEGDRVEIFGVNNSILLIAEQSRTIPYEILTSISQRVKRTFISE